MEQTPDSFAVDKRSRGLERNCEKERMRRSRRVVVKGNSSSELSSPTALINVASYLRGTPAEKQQKIMFRC